MNLYRGIPSVYLNEIEKQGFVEKPSWWATLKLAAYWADVHTVHTDYEPIILKIAAEDLDEQALEIDWDSVEEPILELVPYTLEEIQKFFAEVPDVHWKDSLEMVGAVKYTKRIPLEKLKVLQL